MYTAVSDGLRFMFSSLFKSLLLFCALLLFLGVLWRKEHRRRLHGFFQLAAKVCLAAAALVLLYRLFL
ncbi:MAG: hypothetical protein Q3966_09975 [Neisseria sp.]|nr:hypothetical protein [Neisseria sp.]